MKTKIIVDSTFDIMPEYKEKVDVVPLTVRFGDEEFIDGVTIDHKTFYTKLAEGTSLPSTSQATPHAFEQQYEKVKAAGEEAVVLTVSSRLSGTYQSAVIASQEYENINVVDSGTGSVGGGILTELALKYSQEGMSAKTIAEKLNQDKQKIIIVALVDTLEYLKRGGRISKTVAFAGTVLNIKPVLSIIDGEISLLGKARGSKHGNNQLIKEINKVGGVDFTKPVLLGYTGLSDELLLQYIKDSKSIWEGNIDTVRHTTIGSVIGTHAGPGAVVVAFFKN